ncbi:MAG: NADH-quinone oxidoreductase subunit C [Acidimicrobiia bacterium]|nr:NADH-quinone oxidoreductase subunit C [Acidimicrobiia bacterium]
MSDVAETEDTEVAVEVDEARESLLAEITEELGDALVESHLRPGDDLWIRVSRDAWVETAATLKDGMGFGFFNFLSAIDWLPSPYGRDMDSQVDLALAPEEAAEPEPMESGYAGGDTRFQVFARVNDITTNRAVTVKVDLPDDDLTIATWIPVYAGANWHEREAAEMFGIEFVGHPNPRNLYLPGDFQGHPMRKDFALLARRIKPWPGIVDVEPMPGEDDEADESSASEDTP